MATAPSHSHSSLHLATSSERQSYKGLSLFIFFVVAGFCTVISDGPPKPLSEQAPAGVFSAARAMAHLSTIARAPHPINSAEHDVVKNYIVQTLQSIGLAPQVQEVTGAPGTQGPLENIACRMQGSTRGKAVLLVAHYDSVSAGPGASDDGVAVAALLESARALKSVPQLKRDVIFLFTDSEERRLMGARAFISGHPWAGDVGIVLNFEARGIRGPSIMFETSNDNGWLIKTLGQAASHPVANSLSYEIYKRLPNDTDFTIFRRAGYSGLNFAFIDGLAYYHTALDSTQNVQAGSLQHHGDYMLELTEAFGNSSSDYVRTADLVYFDLLGKVLVRYSKLVAWVLAGLGVILAGFLLYKGLRKGCLRLGSCAIGLVAMLVGTGITIVGAWTSSQLTFTTHSRMIYAGLRYHPGLYIVAFAAFGLACAASFYALISIRIDSAHLLVGACLGWLGLGLVVSWYLPGGSYVVIWPLLFGLLGGLIAIGGGRSPARMLLMALSGLPAIVIIIPLAHKIFWAFARGSAALVGALVGLVFSLLGGIILEQMSRRWLLPALLAIAGVVFLITALIVPGVA